MASGYRAGLSLAAIAAALWAVPAAAEEGFYQHPTLRGDVLVFASEGDLWRAGATGGEAVRLTNHVEEERDARLSPDGSMVAFTAAYDSASDIYVMPTRGGPPRRLTHLGGLVRTVGWTPDGKVVFLSRRSRGRFGDVLYTVDPADSADPVAIPLWRASDGAFSADGRTLYFVRGGIGLSNDNAAQYRGGAMAQLWRWDVGSAKEAVRMLADFAAPVTFPMPHGDRIWFVSDKDGGEALWSVGRDGSGVRRESEAMPFPIRQAALDGGTILIQNGADLHRFDIASKTLAKVPLSIVSDREQTRLRAIERPLRFFTDATVAPKGNAALVTARGRVAVGFPKERRRIELPIPMDARARQAQLSPDGKTAYVLLDRDVTGGIYRIPADGSGPPVAVSKGYAGYIWNFEVAPDGKSIVFHDKAARLSKLDLASGTISELARSPIGADQAFEDLRFSADSRFVAYSELASDGVNRRSRIYLQSVGDGRRVAASSAKYESASPAFSGDGKWLYFVSDRNFAPTPGHPWGDRHMGVAFPDRGEIYAVALDPAATFPFTLDTELTGSALAAADAPEEEGPDDSKPADDKPEGKGKGQAAKPAARVVFEGLASRLYKVPAAKGMTGSLRAGDKHLFAMRGDNEIVSIAISKDEPKIETFARGALGFDMADDRKTLLVATGAPDNPQLTLVPAGEKMPDKPDPLRVRLADWKLQIDPRAEWQQMFVDAWRLHRDFAYDPALRGIDWSAVRSRLEPFVDRIGHRSELNAILSQMAWSLGILHSQIGAGETPSDSENPDSAYLGADLASVAGGVRILAINDSDPDLVSQLSPLRRPGVNMREGDVITRIDGFAVASMADVASRLAGKAGQEVRLDYTRAGAARSATVRPINFAGEIGGLFRDRVSDTRAAVDRVTQGRIGYVALDTMVADDVADFARDFFGQSERPGMIIDVRGNGGGNVDSIILTALMRKVWAYWTYPGGGSPYPNMQGAYRGHLVVLADETTYSDGETFAAGVKALDIAPVIGRRTAGAGIWLTDRNRLADQGRARIAERPQYRLDGEWLIEGYGVEPDITVENPPHAAFKGQDAQLQAAIDYLNGKIAAEPIEPLVPRPLPPLGTPGKSYDRPDS